MTKLLIIVDDFTGALETGVEFAELGARTEIVADVNYDFAKAKATVLVLDAETRHLSPVRSHTLVHRIVTAAKEAGIPYIYKNTDPALRGNIGSELTAAMEALGVERLPFIPAFPAMNLVTRGGVQFVDGVPVAESPFGQDPFEPVPSSNVRDILAQQTERPVLLLNPDQAGALDAGIQVYDSETDEDLHTIAKGLGTEGLKLSAGCAGFAVAVAETLKLKGKAPKVPQLAPFLFMLCGSVNPVTRRQVKEAERCKFKRICLAVRQKLDPSWMASEGCAQAADRWLADAKTRTRMVLDANDEAADKATRQFAAENDLDMEQMRLRIASSLAGVTKELLDRGLEATLMCVGGDVLLALATAVGAESVTPVCKMGKGVSLACFVYQKKTYYALSTSGGVGEPDLLCRLAERIGA